MARSAGLPLAADEAETAVDEQEPRWPILYTVLFVLTSSVLLWALIIGGIGWLVV